MDKLLFKQWIKINKIDDGTFHYCFTLTNGQWNPLKTKNNGDWNRLNAMIWWKWDSLTTRIFVKLAQLFSILTKSTYYQFIL